MTKSKVLVIGLDGATWNLIKPLAEQGKLPTFKKLMDEGVWGDLQSTHPPFTGPAWVSFATGKNPGKHGIYDFLLPTNRLDHLKSCDSENINGKTFYEILDENEIKPILINLPGSYPPKISGITITSLLTKGKNCIFPVNLIDEVPELKNYRISPEMSLKLTRNKTEYIKDILNLEDNRFECAKKLFLNKKWDFFFLLFSGTDWVQHLIYNKLLSKTIQGNQEDTKLAIRLFENIDKNIKEFIDDMPQYANILFLSDHGFHTFRGSFFVNKWLEENGYLKTEIGLEFQPFPHKFAENLKKAENKKKSIKIKVPAPLVKYLILSDGLLSKVIMSMYRILNNRITIKGDRQQVKPNMYESIAYSTTYSSRSIYLNTKDRYSNGVVDAGEYNAIRSRIIEDLKKLKDPKTKKKVFKDVLRKEDIYSGDCLNRAPDIILVPDEYFIQTSISDSIFNNETIVNDHAMEGIFMAYGPDIKKGVKIENAKIYDIAPTLLHLFGLPIPKDVDGKVLVEIFKEDSELATREIEYQEVVGETEKISEKIGELKSLGKI